MKERGYLLGRKTALINKNRVYCTLFLSNRQIYLPIISAVSEI